ncbi:alkaline phosphatase D family protein [uncultured Nocardioides sp.]|uniref:alkaline phosphatase D family protein n=1 Tax=uncultured Nocardioides sp. TaxID=198441 RepID=UPI0032B2A09B
MTPLDRRGFLRTGTVAAGLAVTPALAPNRAEARAARRYRRSLPAGWTYPVAEELLPFGHGVMSGDPLADRVILWTRLTIPDRRGWDASVVRDPQGFRRVTVRWVVARDPGLRRVVRRGRVTTTAARDWTVKVDADRLPSATTLYYAFEALGWRSPVGRTRTAPAPGDDVGSLTIAHFACTSWWHDVFNSFARVAERNDLDLITHAGDHVYDNSGGHPASRVWADQWSWDTDVDNADVRTPAELRRRYALYYADPQLMAAHHAAPWAIMADQHDYDPSSVDGVTTLSTEQAGRVFFEWTPVRPPLPDGSGRFPTSPGPRRQVPLPRGEASLLSYRVLPFGDLADVVLLDVRRFAGRDGEVSQVLGDRQWAWLERTLLDSRDRAAFRVVVNQVNLGQLRAFNLPAASAFAQAFGMDPNAPQGELYTTAWGGQPAERTRLLSWLREQGILDNVVLSGDSHGFFGNDLVEDPQLPAYEPLTGRGTLGAVGVEMVGSTAGRPGGQDVIAEELYFAAVGGSRGAAFADAEGFDTQYRPAALAPTLTLETAARVANPHLRYFNWRADYGHTIVSVQPDQAVIECWSTPQRVVATDQTLLAQHTTARGAPHLAPVLSPEPVTGPRRGRRAPRPRVRRASS